MKKTTLFIIVLLCSFSTLALTKDEVDFFEKSIRPILVKECYKCHSTKENKAKGQLLLDNKETTLKGGETGPGIVPNDLEQSLVIKAIRYTDSNLQMPPNGKLSSEIISDFEKWVKMGAPDPRTEKIKSFDFAKESKEHWAYQPIVTPIIPNKSSRWISNPIDSYVLDLLNKNNINPSIEADKKILIRRAYYDLIGLPPTEKDVEDFLKNRSPSAYSDLIDKLLNNPMYGERWGRHWLDTARYSDTTGGVNANRESRYTYAYTYRDYVIRSFNEDKPFNRFILEQLAADRLSDIKREDLAGLGFLTLGKNSGNINDIIDDQLDVTFKGFMATTIVCARCHDHKFDPISTKDYYSLHGIFNSITVPSDEEKPVLKPIVETDSYKDYLSKKYSLEKEVENFINTRYSQAMSEFTTNTFKNVYGGYAVSSVAESNKTDFIRDGGYNTRMIQRWLQPINERINTRRGTASDGSPTSKLVKFQKINISVAQRSSLLPFGTMYKVNDSDFKEVFTEFMSVNETNINPYLVYHIKKIGIIKSMKDLAMAYHVAVNSLSVTSTNIPGLIEFRDAIFKNNGPLDIDRNSFSRFYADNGKTMRYDNELRQQQGKLITHELSHPAAPARAMVAVDKSRASDSAVLIKGDPGTRGPIVPRKFINTFSYLNPNNFTNGSGRLELAQCIANENNPLTARVIVNRIWQFHFGEGIVRSVDDFGIQTEKPVHYDLLNYLAYKFMQDGWSIKTLHKLIMTSSTYRQVSNIDGKKMLVDPYNKLYWKMNSLRIDFETLRDTILFLGGKLDTNMGGQPVNLITTQSGEYSTRRTVYGLIDRGRLPEVFTTFDFATPEMTTGKRFQTTVPKQALFLMNNAMVIEQIRNMVTRTEFTRIISEEEKIKALYRICFQREPSPLEIKIGLKYIEGALNEDMSDVKKEYNWKYGYRVITQNGTSKFFEFPKFERDVYQSTNDFFKSSTITKNGGTLSSNPNIQVVRQWISPRNGSISVETTFSIKGGGQKQKSSGTIVLYKNGSPIKSLSSNGSEVKISISDLNAMVGDKFEFTVSNQTGLNKDFSLQVKINEVKDVNSLTPISWNSQLDYKGPILKSDRELNSWERYAHILILSNEMVFIN